MAGCAREKQPYVRAGECHSVLEDVWRAPGLSVSLFLSFLFCADRGISKEKHFLMTYKILTTIANRSTVISYK